MAHFNYYKTGSGADRSFRIVKPDEVKIWNDTDQALQLASTVPGTHAQTEINVAITFDAGLCGYPITIPAALPMGEYDILFFNATKAAFVGTETVEAGFGFKWTGSNMYAPVEKIVDRVG
jgi:hypothetical protein